MHKAGAFFLVCAWSLGVVLLLPRPATAAWPTDPAVNLPVCTATGTQYNQAIVPDGAGGAVVSWQDGRSGWDIYAQRVSSDGAVLWAVNGAALCTAANGQYYPAIVSDGAGGAIATWQDVRGGNYDIYAQGVNAMGGAQWWADGVALCSATGDQLFPTITTDGGAPTGGGSGAIVAWVDFRGGTAAIYAQRISVGGTVQWTADGVALCTAIGNKEYLAVASDGTGGAIATWSDYRGGTFSDIYAQRISADGTVQWATDGVAVCTATAYQQAAAIVSAGTGGAIVAWDDYRRGVWDIYAQRISAAGTTQWTANGVALCTATGQQKVGTITRDAAGGAIVTWNDYRSGTDYDIYAQQISAAGAPQWTADGVALCTATGNQNGPRIAANAAGGAIVTWHDSRGASDDIYAQRIGAAGATQWTANGVALCTAAGNQREPVITTDGAHGAIVAWCDFRTGAVPDIYAQRVLANGQLGGDAAGVPGEAPTGLALNPVRPNPSRGGALAIHFTLPGTAAATLELLDVTGRRVAARDVGPMGAGRHTIHLGEDRVLAPGLYLVRLRQGTDARVARAVVLK